MHTVATVIKRDTYIVKRRDSDYDFSLQIIKKKCLIFNILDMILKEQ